MDNEDELTFNDKTQYIADLLADRAEDQKYIAILEQEVRDQHKYILEHETMAEIGRKLYRRMSKASLKTVEKFCEQFYPQYKASVLVQRFSEARNEGKLMKKRKIKIKYDNNISC